jgi:endogenous inhibitor of DNA gyrase (YacG/DUF329 family)
MKPDSTTRWVRCPACGGESLYAAVNPFRPFCGERCKDFDLGAWASESFRVSTSPTDDDLNPPEGPGLQ